MFDRGAVMKDVRIDTFGMSVRTGRRIRMTHFPTATVVSADVKLGQSEYEVKEALRERLLSSVFGKVREERTSGA